MEGCARYLRTFNAPRLLALISLICESHKWRVWKQRPRTLTVLEIGVWMELSRIRGEGSFGCSLLKNYKTGLGGGDAETVLEQPG